MFGLSRKCKVWWPLRELPLAFPIRCYTNKEGCGGIEPPCLARSMIKIAELYRGTVGWTHKIVNTTHAYAASVLVGVRLFLPSFRLHKQNAEVERRGGGGAEMFGLRRECELWRPSCDSPLLFRLCTDANKKGHIKIETGCLV